MIRNRLPQNLIAAYTASQRDIEVTFIENNSLPNQNDPYFEAIQICLIYNQELLKTMIDIHSFRAFSQDI